MEVTHKHNKWARTATVTLRDSLRAYVCGTARTSWRADAYNRCAGTCNFCQASKKDARTFQISSFSIASFNVWIWLFSWLPSFVVTEAEITCKQQRALKLRGLRNRKFLALIQMEYSYEGCLPALRRHMRVPGRPWMGQRHRAHSVRQEQKIQHNLLTC